jgi:hypothetical protein
VIETGRDLSHVKKRLEHGLFSQWLTAILDDSENGRPETPWDGHAILTADPQPAT